MSEIPGMSRRQFIQYQNQIMMRSMSDPRFMLFTGNAQNLDLKIQDLDKSQISYHEAHITIKGEQKKEEDFCCLLVTVIFAALFFPLVLLTCCDWWKKKVHPIHEIPFQAYQQLTKIMLRSEMKTFSLIVTDTAFDNEKAKVVIEALQQGKIKEFTFINCAKDIDYKGTQFSSFEENMKPIKSLDIKSKLTWYSKNLE